jgi:hypothetical protein
LQRKKAGALPQLPEINLSDEYFLQGGQRTKQTKRHPGIVVD